MKKDITDICNCLKNIIVPDMPVDFSIAEPFRHGLADAELRAGMTAFRRFLFDLINRLSIEGADFDPKKAAMYDPENGMRSMKCFPAVTQLPELLFFIGYHGKLDTEPTHELTVTGSDLLLVPKPKSEKFMRLGKISGKRLSEYFNFLSEMGFYFEGLDCSKRIDLSKTSVFHVTNENDSNIILGLKLIVEAVMQLKSDYVEIPALLRGYFYPLENETLSKHKVEIGDCIQSQPPEIREWIIGLDNFLTANGCSFKGEFIEWPYFSRFTYTSRKSKQWVCILEMKITGDYIKPNCNYAKRLDFLQPKLTENMLRIMRSDGCGCGASVCQYGGAFKTTYNDEEFISCRFVGFPFPMDNADERGVITEWVKKELALSI